MKGQQQKVCEGSKNKQNTTFGRKHLLNFISFKYTIINDQKHQQTDQANSNCGSETDYNHLSSANLLDFHRSEATNTSTSVKCAMYYIL